MVGSRDLRWMHGAVAVVASWRWRDAVFEDPFGRSPEWIKFAEPSSDSAMRFIQRWSRRQPSTSLTPSGVRVRRAKEINQPLRPFVSRVRWGDQERPAAFPPLTFHTPILSNASLARLRTV